MPLFLRVLDYAVAERVYRAARELPDAPQLRVALPVYVYHAGDAALLFALAAIVLALGSTEALQRASGDPRTSPAAVAAHQLLFGALLALSAPPYDALPRVPVLALLEGLALAVACFWLYRTRRTWRREHPLRWAFAVQAATAAALCGLLLYRLAAA